MTYKIAVFGSAINENKDTIEKAHQIGEELAKRKSIIITGACPGLPFEVARNAHKFGSKVWGYSSFVDEKGQNCFTPGQNLKMYSKIVYIPNDFEFTKNSLVTKKYRKSLQRQSAMLVL